MRNDYPMCKGKRRDCFAYMNEACTVLSDTEFNRPCPFYKTAEQAAKENEKHTKKVTLIGKYKRRK